MGIEIERKYLVVNDGFKSSASSKCHIKQGYLCRDVDRTVRIRIADDKGFITVKGRNKGDTRLEFEYPVPLADAEKMLGLCSGRILDKIRYFVDYGGFRWEVDEFLGDLSPLVVAEIELKDSSEQFPLPPFVGEDVTGRPEYYNSML